MSEIRDFKDAIMELPNISFLAELFILLQVRVFTYLIGRDMTFAENVKWIACNNKGEFDFRSFCGCYVMKRVNL